MSNQSLAHHIEAPENTTALPPDCKVKPIGYMGSTYYFWTATGAVQSLNAAAMTSLNLMSLFSGNLEAMGKMWGAEKGSKASFDQTKLAADLMQACIAKGVLIAPPMVRRRGLWPRVGSGGQKGWSLHCGDLVLDDTGTQRPAGFEVKQGSEVVSYPTEARGCYPAAQALSAADCQDILDLLQTWTWKADGMAELFLGWLGAAFYGAASPWRTHMVLAAPPGAGKTSLLQSVSLAMNGLASNLITDPTAAGLYEAFDGQSIAAILDEAEKQEGRRAEADSGILDWIRSRAGQDGARKLRHGSDAKMSIGAVLMGAVQPKAFRAADRSRIIQLQLGPLAPGLRQTTLEDGQAMLKARAPALQKRMLDGWGRYLDAFRACQDAMQDRGYEPRAAKVWGNVLAAYHVMICDGALEVSWLADMLDRVDPIMRPQVEDSSGSGGQDNCLAHLLTMRSPVWRAGSQDLIGSMIWTAWQSSDTEKIHAARKELQSLGLKVWREQSGDMRWLLAIAGGEHSQLRKLFEGTPWSDGGWTQALRSDPRALPSKVVRFAGSSRVRSSLFSLDSLGIEIPNYNEDGGE